MGFTVPFLLSKLFLASLLFITLVTAAALKNITLALPEGTTDHGDPGLLCFPTGWTDLFTFYLGNYAAHAGTVKFLPGEKIKDMIPTVVISLLFPAFGAFRGIMNCLSGAIFARRRGPFQMAVRARALCMVVRGTNWTPAEGDEVTDVVVRANQTAENGDAGDGEFAVFTFLRIFVLIYLISGFYSTRDCEVSIFFGRRDCHIGVLDSMDMEHHGW
jgi:hypothetical protein